MKINEPSRIGGVNPYHKQQDGKLTGAGKEKAKLKDQLQISPEAKELQELQAASQKNAADPARLAKVEELKQQVSTGTYRVDSGKIAEKLLPYLK
ncbi:flagellar biosynthesis anti-sigma factor FlgM [Gorillibacterium timonense]|uniref:flagellar biosynthesis anti-sigma factor FlgM n=1 Tax=Gorillibacterium timonense TaxID=1689269 RepID=UPI00071C9640|nr:flagellar biosynthesis anti-sigma factor FlgM [Gorillibacterium timonense]